MIPLLAGFFACFFLLSPGSHVGNLGSMRLRMKETRREEDVSSYIEFAHTLGRLKTIPRTGWVRRKVPRYESVADHTYRVAALNLIVPPNLINVTRCLKMALIHDLAETVVGDIAPDDNVSKHDKQQREKEAFEDIVSLLPSAIANELLDLFHEYEQRTTVEAKAVKDMDMLDMILQADEYENAFGIPLGEFFDGTPIDRFHTPFFKHLATQVHRNRNERLIGSQQHELLPGLSRKDAAFVTEFSKASRLAPEEVESVVKALRCWESRDG